MNTAIPISIFILFFISIIQPVAAGPVDDGIDMVARGMERFVEFKAEQNLNKDFGISFGDNGNMSELTPAQKLVYMVGAAEQHPFEQEDIRTTIAHDVVWYYIFGLIAIMYVYIGSLAQDKHPESISSISEKLTGHDGFFGSRLTFKTTMKIAFAPIAALLLIEFFMDLEQLMSSGLMQDALQYIQLSTKTVGVFLFESVAYASCGEMFATRILYINFVCKHIIKILLLIMIPWGTAIRFAKLLGVWFVSCLFARPIVLWYSSLAVEDIASKETTAGMIAATTFDMSLVVVLSAVTMFILVMWPIIKFIIEVIVDYVMGAVFKALKMYNNIKLAKRL